MGWVVDVFFFTFFKEGGDDGGTIGDGDGGDAFNCGMVFLGFLGVGGEVGLIVGSVY